VFDTRTWAIESAGGLGYLLAQQLVAAGEEVLDVQPMLAARVRVLGSGRSAKNDANDARSVAIAALRATSLRAVCREDHLTVMRMLTRRHRDLGRERTRVACRAHALICELIPGGIPKRLRNEETFDLLRALCPPDEVSRQRQALALELVDDLRRIDVARKASQRRVEAAVAASATSLTDLFGIGPVCAAILLTQSGDIGRFATKDHYAAYNGTAPIEASSGNRRRHRLSRRGNRQLNYALHVMAVVQISHPGPGADYYHRKLAEGKSTKEALRSLKRRLSDVVYRQLVLDHRRLHRPASSEVREDTQGRLEACVAG
jgi:transposase